MIELERVTVRLGGRDVVEDVSLRVEPGSWLTLIGPNGAGKTSLLGAISGLLHAEGRIVVDGGERRELGSRQLARLLAIVPQDPLIPPDMTVGEFVLLGRTPYVGYFGRLGRADRRAAEEAVARLGLADLAGRPLGTLSGGERQRAVLARALAQQAPVLLLDEPTAALDIGRQQEVLELLAGLHAERGLTVLAAMHDLTLACQYADRLALIDGGRLVAWGKPAEVLSEAAIACHYRATVRVTELGEDGPVVVPVRRKQPPLEKPSPPPPQKRESLVIVNTGDGKGKSTAAFGVVLRAVAREWPVSVIQFVKSDRWQVGEEEVARRLGVDWAKTGDGFSWLSDDLERSQALAAAAWELAEETLAAGRHRLVVLDEITYPMNWGWIPTEAVAEAIAGRPPQVNVIATGRDAPSPLLEVADTVTEMAKVRHAYDAGVRAMRGLDF